MHKKHIFLRLTNLEPNLSDILEEDMEPIEIKLNELNFFHLFIIKWPQYFYNKPVTKSEIAKAFSITPRQVDDWLELALKEKLVDKQKRPAPIPGTYRKLSK